AAGGLTKHLAIEWAAQGIRVNAVAPGTILTEAVRALPEQPGGSEYIEAIRKLHPMARLGEPAEVARAIAFLASDDASFITGAILPVDGGYLAQEIADGLAARVDSREWIRRAVARARGTRPTATRRGRPARSAC